MALVNEATVETLWDRDGETPYQTRAVAGRLRVHIFWRGDRDLDMHDHPADFWTFPLVSYVEEIEHPWSRGHTEWRLVRAFRLHRRKAAFAHRVLGAWTGEFFADGSTPKFTQRPIVTIGWWGKKRRDWGFHTEGGWVPWKVYVSQPGWSSSGEQPLGSSERQRAEGKEARDKTHALEQPEGCAAPSPTGGER